MKISRAMNDYFQNIAKQSAIETDRLIMDDGRHAKWIKDNAAALVLDYTSDEEYRPHKSLYNMLSILLMWRTGADMEEARKAIELAADELARERVTQQYTEWLEED